MALFNYMKKFYYIYLLPWERNNNIQHLFWVGKLLTNKRYTPSFPYVNQVLCKVLQMFLRTNSPSVLLNSQCVALTITLILFIFNFILIVFVTNQHFCYIFWEELFNPSYVHFFVLSVICYTQKFKTCSKASFPDTCKRIHLLPMYY